MRSLENESLTSVSFIAYQELGYHYRRIIKFLVIAFVSICTALIAAFVICNALWLKAWTEYDYSSETEHVTIDSHDGTATYIADNSGDVVNGSNNSQKD